MGFKQPPQSSGPDLKALYGSLLLITSLRTELRNTKFGEKEALFADMVVLDGEHAGETYENFPIWGVWLIDQLKPLIGSGDRQLGRLSQLPAQPGQSAAWALDGFTDDDEQRAVRHLDGAAIGTAEGGETTDDAPPLDDEPPF